jgi:16S rRNA (guanine527-N7)-methyltransferase
VERPRKPLPTRVDETPDLPAAYVDALERGLDALGLSLTMSARSAIDGHARLLLAWTQSINLTGIREPAAVALGHVVDSLSGLAILGERQVDRFVDLGSGGGYPALPLAAALPAARALLAEPIGKKAGFLKTVIEATDLQGIAEAAPVRAESLAGDARHRGQWPAVVARAVAGLPELVELAFPLLAPGGILIAWKRGDLAIELAAAEHAVAALGGGRLEVRPVHVPGLEGHCLVIATARGHAPETYPRDPGTRKRRPW